MRLSLYGTARWMLLLGALAVLADWEVGVRAVDPEQPKKVAEPESPPPMPKAKATPPPDKTIAFEMRDKPWSGVLEWLSDQANLPIITNYKPTGTFTFIAPKKKTYTIPEVIDILNEALLNQKYILIRREASFTIVPADEKIDPAILPRIRLEDLNERGNTEMVSVVLPLTSLVAEDVAAEVKKMLGPFGDVVAMNRANQLVLQDTVGNLKRVYRTLKDIEENEKGQAESYSHSCKYVKAREAERILRELLGDPRELLRMMQPAPQQFGGGFSGGSSSSSRPPSAPAVALPKLRMHYISADERLNTVLVNGPADKIAQAKEILKKLDVPQQGQLPVLVGTPLLKTYGTPAGNAEALSKTLQEIYKASSSIRISAVGNHSIMVWAGPDDQFEIARHIASATEPKNSSTELVPLNLLDAVKVADTLKGMFGDPKSGAPYLEADTTRNAVIVKGTREQVEEVKAALKALGEGPGVSSGNMRIISLDKGSAATLAEALERLLPQMRQNPVKVIHPGQEPRKPEPPREKPKSEGDTRAPAPPPNGTLLARADDSQLADPRAQKKTDKPGRADAPVTITAFGNRLIVTSDDPQALALVQELVRLLTQTPGGEGDFEIIRLKNASATEAAKVLDEAFNGPRQQTTTQRGGGFSGGGGDFFSRFSAPAASLPTSPAANRIRVVADASTNSLLVRASPLDMLTVRRLLEKALDVGETDSRAVIRTWMVGPFRHTTATEVANVVRDVYREHMNTSPTSTTVGGFPGFGFFGSRSSSRSSGNVDASGNPRAVTLSVGVDERSNSLVVACSEAMYEDIKKMIEQLEKAARDTTRTIKVIPIKGVDPVLVQQAIDAIQGRGSTLPRPSTGTGSGSTPGGFTPGGMSPFRPSGGGGFMPGTGSPSGGGGRSGAPPGSSRGPGGSSDSRGLDFFAERVTDDPQSTLLFDPRPESWHTLQPVGLEQQPPQPGEEPLRGPRSSVTAEALPELGIIVLSGTAADIAEVLKVIESIQRLGADVQPEIKLFQLQKADASAMAGMLQQLFLGTGFQGGQQQLLQLQQTQTQQAMRNLRFSVDDRTNSLLVIAPRNDLDVIEAIISRLEDADLQLRHNEVIRLKNASAADVANALQSFLTRSLQVLAQGAQLTAFQEVQRDVIIVPEPITNSLLISATPTYQADIIRMVQELDSQPPQVVIQVLVAEVDFSNDEEFGVELGLQSPVLFERSVTPLANLFGTNGSVNFATPQVPQGVTVNSTINPAALPGYAFNSTGALGSNPAANAPIVGFQGLGNLGVGRISPNHNVGGFLFSAGSNSVNLLIRALKTQGRLDVLSRPQLMTLDNQTALLNVGKEIPIVTSSNVTATGVISNNIDRRNVGVILQVTPRISPEGTVLMRVVPEISSVDPIPVNLGNGQQGTQLNIQHLETTVIAQDGETVAIGGLITKRDSKTENKIPWLGDLPVAGALFRFRNQRKEKVELLLIMTPHIVRSRADADRILAEEARRMDWLLNDVTKVHGTSGMGPILEPKPGPGPVVPIEPPGAVPPRPVAPPADEVLPPPRPLPGPAAAPQEQGAHAPRPPAPTVLPTAWRPAEAQPLPAPPLTATPQASTVPTPPPPNAPRMPTAPAQPPTASPQRATSEAQPSTAPASWGPPQPSFKERLTGRDGPDKEKSGWNLLRKK